MESVKTYQNVNKEDSNVHFGISRMENIYAKRKGAVDAPHRHDYYTIMIVVKSKGIHKIDFNEYPLEKRQIFLVAPGQVHQVIEEHQSFGYAMTFSIDFLIKNSIPLAFISDLNLFESYGQSPPLKMEQESFNRIIHFAQEIDNLFQGNQNQKMLSIGAYLKLLLIECSNSCSLVQDDNMELGNSTIIRSFKKEVDQNYRKEHSTSFYADKLNISPDHLNRLVKEKLGKTAKEYIQSRITTEAKRLLYFTSLSNKEIGYELGFNEPANFSAFFKKCTQLSPSNFKKAQHL